MLNKRRVNSAKSTESTKKRRKLIRAPKKTKGHKQRKTEGNTYKTGGF